jgi:uncharacterized integral membrane protein
MDAGMRPPSVRDDRSTRDWGAIVVGLVFVAVGVYFALKETFKVNLPDIEWDMAWPIIILAIGLVILVRAATGRDRQSTRRDR